MRYQERIYIQNEHGAVRNKDILNVNMSSDICVFDSPLFSLSGASKIDCTGVTGTSYVISSETSIPLTFIFTGNTDSFTANSATFNYEIYKYNSSINAFIIPAVYKSSSIDYSAFSATNITTQNIPVDSLKLDGEYLVKGFYIFDNCTFFMNLLGKQVNTLNYNYGTQYGLYNPDLDYYFIALRKADIPTFASNGSNTPPNGFLYQEVIFPTVDINDDTNSIQNIIVVGYPFVGAVIVTLNGLVLSPSVDYSLSGNIITLSGAVVSDDIFTLIYTTAGGNPLASDSYEIISPIVSGVTDNQGSNNVYFNTITGKYEVYTSITPVVGNSVILMVNGVTLANGIDYYQSVSNPKRLILEGGLSIGDLITIVYFPTTDVSNGLINNSPNVTWNIVNGPTNTNGFFSLEVSTGNTFNDFYSTGFTNYIIDQTTYMDSFIASGSVGTELYYRVKNEKSFTTFCGDIITSISYSETIKTIIQSNEINTY